MHSMDSEVGCFPPESRKRITAAAPSSYEAAHAVLNTNELLCDIVGYLSLENIVVTTGVCKTWRRVLKASKAIQQTLFLAPADIHEILTELKHDYLHTQLADIPRDKYRIVVECHPSLTTICGRVLSFGGSEDSEEENLRDGCGPRPDFGHPAGVWRDMFITQPPVQSIHVVRMTRPESPDMFGMRDRNAGPIMQFTLRCNDGIKMGRLHDFIQAKANVPSRLDKRGLNMAPDMQLEALPDHSLRGDICNRRRWEIRNGKATCRVDTLVEYDDEEDGVEYWE
jgi:hypothetical protein